MILVTGEILFDLFKDRKRMGGAPFNFAFHLKKLGFDVRFVSRVGKDDLGKEILDFLASHGFDTKDIQIDPDLPTGTVTVTSSKNSHTFTITPDTAWDRTAFSGRMAACLKQGPDLIYFGSLVQRTSRGHALIDQIMTEKQGKTKVFCDINLRPASYTKTVVETCLSAADILKLNQEELAEIKGDAGTSHKTAARKLMSAHGIQLVILTLGSDGSTWITPDTTIHRPAVTPERIKDTVGAGDAYAAVCAAGILKNLPFETCMDLASAFASHICTMEGALPKKDNKYREIKQRIYKNGF
ncbi:MAG: carbohydrate kinase [Desulfotignum sp.]|nr:carbohydrate kinase [Desulfotignum sp.]